MTGRSEHARHWTLDPDVVFLNHGSFGACPRQVQQAQQALRDQLDRQPLDFFVTDYEARLDAARAELAAFVGVQPHDLVFVTNATTGVNAVLGSYDLRAGDRLLVTDHGYNACTNAARYVAERAGASVDTAHIPFPIDSAAQVVEAIVDAITPRTRLLLVDHVTSPTALVLPIADIAAACAERGVDVLVDGAHAPGMLPLDIEALGVAYYTGNCHKWLCAPRGAALLWVRPDLQPSVRPTVISHGANRSRVGRSRYLLEFDWTGTGDPTAAMCVGDAIRTVGDMLDGGWNEVMARNHALALQARDTLCAALDTPPPAPDDMLGSMAAVPLPDGAGGPPTHPFGLTDLQLRLRHERNIEVPVVAWPAWPARLVRASAALYNGPSEYTVLADALRAVL